MTEYDYINQINTYNNQISDYQNKLRAIQAEIDEAEEALRDARTYSNKFYDAVDHKKSRGQSLVIGNGLRAVLSWSKKINNMLTGREFTSADQSIQDIISSIKAEIKRLSSDYDYYEEQIQVKRNQISSTQTELDAYRRNQAEEAARRAREAEAQRAAAAHQQAQAKQQSQPKAQPKAQQKSKPKTTSNKSNKKDIGDAIEDAFKNLFRW